MTFRLFLLLLLAARCGAANLLPNSSFEFGGAGWLADDSALPTLITNAGASHGAVAAVLASGTRLDSGPIALLAGSYSLSFDGKTLSGLQGPYLASVTASAQDPGVSVGSLDGNWTRKILAFNAPSNGNYYVHLVNNQPDAWIDSVQLEAGPATPYAPKFGQSLLCVWDANKESFCAGYRVCAGASSRRYTFTNTVVGRFNTNGTVPLMPGVMYLAVLAYAEDGTSSPFSAEALWITRPGTPVRFRVSGTSVIIE